MRVLNLGSMNVDYVYSVPHIIIPGETLATGGRNTFAGGKGLNQSIAMAKAGLPVYHAGITGNGGEMLVETLQQNHVDTSLIQTYDGPVGHTVIQVDKNGQNCILLFGGGNQCLTKEFIDETLSQFGSEDVLVLQNEVNLMPYIIDSAAEKGLKIVLNPSPFREEILQWNLKHIGVFFINEIEGAQIAETQAPEEILKWFAAEYPDAVVVLTLGSEGSQCLAQGEVYTQKIYPAKAVDTTAAGDTFSGFFLAQWLAGKTIPECLDLAARASSITVSREGAAGSIPTIDEVLKSQQN